MVLKGRRRDHRARATALAKAVNAAIRVHDQRSPHSPFAIDDATSRILENDPDYHPPRKRRESKKRAPTKNPGIFTVTGVADRLGITVGELLHERGYEITQSDLRSFRWIADFLQMRFAIDMIGAVNLPDEHSFVEKEFSFPRALMSTAIERKGELAAGLPLESDFEVTAAEVIGTSKTATLFAATVKGRSMTDRYRDGDTIVLDSAQTMPKQNDPVAVYIHNEGGVLGYRRAEAGSYYLDKHNGNFPFIKLGHPSEWHVLGVITLVQSRVSRQDKPTLRRS